MGAIGQISFHFAFFSVEHLSDLSCVNRSYSLIGHRVLHIARSFLLPGSGSPCETVFIPDEETVEKEKEHVTELRKWDGNEHHFSCQDV
jgi:hypothetical protein